MSVYLGPWQWDESTPSLPHWALPLGCQSAVDLRSLPDQGQRGGTPGVGVFVTDAALSSEYVLLGEHPTARASAQGRSAWESLTGYAAQGARVVDLVWDHLTFGADPDGGTGPKPLLPGRNGGIHWSELHLGGNHRNEPFVWGEDAVATERVRELLRRDFRRTFADAQAGRLNDRKHHRRILDMLCEQYGVADWREFVPADLRADIPGRLPHKTTITDPFTRGDQVGLGTSSEGWSWTIVAGTINIVSNKAVSTLNQLNLARAEIDLSSADHYAQALSVTSPDNRGLGACVRFHGTDQTFYFYTRDGNRLFKAIAGTNTLLAQAGSSPAPPFTLKTQANGSAITGHYDGVQQVSATDTSITGNTRTGLRQDVIQSDDYQAADLAAGGVNYVRLRKGTNSESGLWQIWRH